MRKLKLGAGKRLADGLTGRERGREHGERGYTSRLVGLQVCVQHRPLGVTEGEGKGSGGVPDTVSVPSGETSETD